MHRAISLDTVAIVTGVSKRTLWRRLNDREITRQENDARGRAMLTLNDITPMLCIPLLPEDYELLTGADGGDADAQNDLAQLFMQSGKTEIALLWLHLAAEQQHADAMHNLSTFYLSGAGVEGVTKDNSKAMMWLAKAAAHGHVIARQQLTAWIGVGEE